ncbi:MAG: aldehyde dehydrogenase, partial [Verrucomicrobia bacterium]|nr:aldehyde dehydrogenase [Verrucomicrobiota bacterium]
ADKIAKNTLVIEKTPGLEVRDFGMAATYAGDNGLTFLGKAPWGVIGAVTPSTNPGATIINNSITMLSAGNVVVFNTHPHAKQVSNRAAYLVNCAIRAAGSAHNLIFSVRNPTHESSQQLMQHPDIKLLVVTGGPEVVRAAMASGKRVIAAGPGNPPVIVDGTGNLAKAAADIISGAAFDNNLLCIGEKQVFVLEHIAERFMNELASAGAAKLTSSQLAKLTASAFTDAKDAGGCSHPVLNRKLVGADAAVLAQHAGATVTADCPLLFAETDADHVFVLEEQMMPMLPIVRVKDFNAAVAAAAKSEHGYKHSCVIHSLNVERMTQMARALDTTLFVKNGPSTAGLGLGGEGYLSYSIATTTGEGITTPETFTRTRRCVMVDNLRIY